MEERAILAPETMTCRIYKRQEELALSRLTAQQQRREPLLSEASFNKTLKVLVYTRSIRKRKGKKKFNQNILISLKENNVSLTEVAKFYFHLHTQETAHIL